MAAPFVASAAMSLRTLPVPPTVTLDRIAAIAAFEGWPCVTITMPVDRRHPSDRLDHGVLDRLLDTARRELSACGVDRRAVDRVLAPIEQALAEPFIGQRVGGQAFFAAPDHVESINVGTRLEPSCTVDDRFVVAPLLPAVDPAVGGHVLMLDVDHIRLLRIDAADLHECHVDGLPRSIDEALWYERFERSSGWNSSTTNRQHHGMGAQHEDAKHRTERFFHAVDHAVLEHLGTNGVHPLVVVGSSSATARYRSITHHPWTIALHTGAPSRVALDELRRRIAEQSPSWHPSDQLLERLRARLGTGLAAVDTAEIATAASQGAVQTLFVADRHAADLSTVNRAVSDALRTQAIVRLVPPDALPEGASLAALYRY